MPCRFASSGTVATSRSASRAILALNVASNFLRDLVISVLHRLRQSRTLHTLTFGPISGVHFRYCHSSTSNSPKKSLPFGLAVSGCADLLKPPNVAAQPQPDRLLVWNCRRRAGATSGLNKLTFGDAKKVDFEHLGCCRWPTYMPIQFSSGRYPIR